MERKLVLFLSNTHSRVRYQSLPGLLGCERARLESAVPNPERRTCFVILGTRRCPSLPFPICPNNFFYVFVLVLRHFIVRCNFFRTDRTKNGMKYYPVTFVLMVVTQTLLAAVMSGNNHFTNGQEIEENLIVSRRKGYTEHDHRTDSTYGGIFSKSLVSFLGRCFWLGFKYD